jgi:hypothetical protein
LAARNGHQKLLKLLVHDYAANTRLVDSDGFTAVHWLANNGRAELLKLLLNLGQPVDLQDRQGQTALHIASHAGHAACVSFLLGRSASVCALDLHGRNPLYYACRNGAPDCTAILLAHNAVVLRDVDGVDALDICFLEKHPKPAAKLLLNDPMLLLRVVRAAVEQPDDEPTVAATLIAFASHNISAAGVALQSVADLAADTGKELLCQSTDPVKLGAGFTAVCRVLVAIVQALKAGPLAVTEGQVLTQFINNAVDLLNPAWEALEQWLLLLAMDHPDTQPTQLSGAGGAAARVGGEAGASGGGGAAPAGAAPVAVSIATELKQPASGRGGCYSSGPCIGGGCYSPSCRAAAREEKVSLQLLDRVATMVHVHVLVAEGILHEPECGGTPPGVFEMAARHAGALRWIIRTEPAIIFSRFSFALRYPCMIALFGVEILKQPFDLRVDWFHEQLAAQLATRHPPAEAASPVVEISRENVSTLPYSYPHPPPPPLPPYHPLLHVLFEPPSLMPPSAISYYCSPSHPTLPYQVFHSSCKLFSALADGQGVLGAAAQLQHRFAVQFTGEPGIGEGVKREWISLLSQEMCNPDFGLFTPSADGTTFHLNPNSGINQDHLSYFEFTGSVVGLALLHKQLLGITFSPIMYKQLCGKHYEYEDAAAADPELAASLEWILTHDITDLDLGLTFSTSREHFGQAIETELLPNGAKIPVTEDNKTGFVHLLTSQKFSGSVRDQMRAFMKGFHQFIPRNLVALFDELELERLLSGEPKLDAADWRANTHYSGYKADSAAVGLFWDVVDEMTSKERKQLLQFATGSTRVPTGGFAQLRGSNGIQLFTLSEDAAVPATERLPTASTCFNLLKLPPYPTKQTMHQKLILALRLGGEGGFGFT